ncbi:hypothetical protein WJX73_002122 [Symbiochloris irregularis]|uniref:Short-chain dehydrogenase n=1 Tax=Symbiochloris irregularis TaxID=706552 RepID=A0AAW1NJY6_9CHLO
MASERLLKGNLAVVTGASRGIGRAISERFAREGARLALVGRSEAQLKQVAESCEKLGAASTHVYAVDLSKPDLVEDFAKRVLEEHAAVSVLVNNAGMPPKGDGIVKGEGDMQSWQQAVNVNLVAPMVLTNFFTPSLIKQSGLIANIASVAGVEPMKGNPVYAATKWGLRGFSLSCYEALRNENVKVICINPAAVKSDMTEGGPYRADRMLQPEDIAETIMHSINLSDNAVVQDITLRLALSAMK